MENKDNNTNVEYREVANMKVEIHIVKGIECIDRIDAMNVLGIKYPNQLKDFVDRGIVKVIGDIPVQGKTTKRGFDLKSVLKAKEVYKPRGSDPKVRYEVKMYPNDKEYLEYFLSQAIADCNDTKIEERLKGILVDLKGAVDLTEKSRVYMANYNAKKE